MHHKLKTWPRYFEEIASGRLAFSIRDNQGRGFQKGDTVDLQEFDPDKGEYTGYELRRLEITYVESSWGLSPGHVVIGFPSAPVEGVFVPGGTTGYLERREGGRTWTVTGRV